MKPSTKAIPNVCRGLILVCAAVLGGQACADGLEPEPAISVAADAGQLEWGPCPEFFGEGCHIAALHGDPGQPNSDLLFRLAGQREFPAHHHTSAERMVLISGVLDVTYEGQDSVSLAAGDYAYGPPGRIHYGQCVSDEPCVLFIAFEQPVDAMQVEMQ